MLPVVNFPRMNTKGGAPKHEHYDNSKTSGNKKDDTVTVNLGGRPTKGKVLFFFTDDHNEEHAGVLLDRLFLVRKVSDFVS